MSLITIDATSWISAWRRDTKLFEWVTLLVTLTFSGVTSFLFICGSCLVAKQSWPVAIGSGMAMAAVMMTIVWRSSTLTKGTTIALPEEEAIKEIETNAQIIRK